MGIISNWFSGSSSGAGKIETKQSGPAAASNKPNVWRSVFDPGSNPNIDRVGSNYYDTVHKVNAVLGSCLARAVALISSSSKVHRGPRALHCASAELLVAPLVLPPCLWLHYSEGSSEELSSWQGNEPFLHHSTYTVCHSLLYAHLLLPLSSRLDSRMVTRPPAHGSTF
jgi:hypothetical protein